jgi:hypothetical protein
MPGSTGGGIIPVIAIWSANIPGLAEMPWIICAIIIGSKGNIG